MDDKQLMDALRGLIREETAGFATKEDLERVATKEDLEGFATKEDFEKFATKDDLEGFATKEDLEGFATKEDLKGFATKEDLERFATKEDLEGFASKDDLKAMESSLRAVMDEKDRQLHVLFENSVSRIENLLREDYGRVAASAAKVADYDEVKSKVSEHQSALENHNERLTELEKKAI